MSTDRRQDKRWNKKCEKLILGKEDFTLSLVELFIQKIEERCDLIAKIQIVS